MLTETLAMYPEMMLYKQRYGDKKVKDRLKIHQQIYESKKRLSAEMPLYKVLASASYIAYSKGAVIMVKLSELAGENKLNAILRLFIQKYRYPHRAITLDFCNRCISIQNETIIKLLRPCLQMFSITR